MVGVGGTLIVCSSIETCENFIKVIINDFVKALCS